jgi:hypothetical protein
MPGAMATAGAAGFSGSAQERFRRRSSAGPRLHVMTTRTRTRCDRLGRRSPSLPARRAACRRALPEFSDRMYIVLWEDGAGAIDILDRSGTFVSRFCAPDRLAVAETLLRDATGSPPRPATTAAFSDELLTSAFTDDGLAITSGEVCAWLLLRAIG